MKIIDLKGEKIEITNLEEALKQAQTFKDCYDEKNQILSEERKKYWQDIYKKLKKMKSYGNKK